MHKRWLIIGGVAVALTFLVYQAAQLRDESELVDPQAGRDTIEGAVAPEPEHGTDPGRDFLPESAVDTDELPNIVLREDDPVDAPLPYYRIAPNTYFLFGNVSVVDKYNRGWTGNAGFVVTSDGVVVIDALGTPKLGRRLIATIRSVTDQPVRHLILTHNHPDHAYGAAAFRQLADVTIIGHQGTLDYLNSDTIDASVAYRTDMLGTDMSRFVGVKPDRMVGGEPFTRYTLNVGAQRFDLYNVGRHHSYGDLIVHQVQDGILWVGDLVFNQRTTYMADGDSAMAIRAQDWVRTQFPDLRLMVPGHGSAQTPPFPMLDDTQDYMQRLRERMAEAIDAGIPLEEAADTADFKDWRGVRLYEQNHRANAHFVYREMEQELF